MSELSSLIHCVCRGPWLLSISRYFLALAVLSLSACGDSDSGINDQIEVQPSNVQSENEDAQAELAAAFGAGKGGGDLTFNGTSYAIESAVCRLGPPVEVGTVGNGYRVLIDGTQNPRASILDPDFVLWTHIDWQTANFTVTGSLITGSATSYRNNVDDRVIEANFEIECPEDI